MCHNGKSLSAFPVLDSLCPTPGDRKERMTIDARQESRCGIRSAGSPIAYRVNRAAIAENVATSRKAFGYRLISPYLALSRLISPFCGAASPLKGVFGNGDRLKPELQTDPKAVATLRKADVSEVFAAGEVNSSTFARLCPPVRLCPPFFWREVLEGDSSCNDCNRTRCQRCARSTAGHRG